MCGCRLTQLNLSDRVRTAVTGRCYLVDCLMEAVSGRVSSLHVPTFVIQAQFHSETLGPVAQGTQWVVRPLNKSLAGGSQVHLMDRCIELAPHGSVACWELPNVMEVGWVGVRLFHEPDCVCRGEGLHLSMQQTPSCVAVDGQQTPVIKFTSQSRPQACACQIV
jgi:hypothetical protein